MADVNIDYATMQTLSTQLASIVQELELAQSRSEDLIAAINTPYGRTHLADRAGEFESRWEDKRGELADQLKEIQEHVEAVLEGFREGDSELAAGMEEAS